MRFRRYTIVNYIPLKVYNNIVLPQGTGAQHQDYSQQWIDYYRSQGLHADAEKIEAQLKSQKVRLAPQLLQGSFQ